MLREENMNSRPLWDQEQEKIFFNKYLEVASPEQLFLCYK